MRIGFVGIGLMGLPIAQHLLAAGHQLFIASSNRAAAQALGAHTAETAAEVLLKAEQEEGDIDHAPIAHGQAPAALEDVDEFAAGKDVVEQHVEP